MAATAISPSNAKVTFTGKGKRMAKKSAPIAEASPAKDDRDWEAESAFRTLQESEKHQANPDMMKRVAKHAEKEKSGLDAVMSKLQKRGLVSDKQAKKMANRREAAGQ